MLQRATGDAQFPFAREGSGRCGQRQAVPKARARAVTKARAKARAVAKAKARAVTKARAKAVPRARAAIGAKTDALGIASGEKGVALWWAQN